MNPFSEYLEAGWKLCAIPRGSKAPNAQDWNTRPLTAEGVELAVGAGLLHALSGTCCLDLDNLDLARPWLAERGIDLDDLLSATDSVQISSGRPNRAKLLYRMKRPLRTLKPKGSGLELRCATAAGASVQDVLPPSVHPDTQKPYEWRYGEELLGDWRRLPAVPAALLALWRELAGTAPVEPIEPTAAAPRVNLAALRKAAFRHSPDAEYDEWIKVGAQLHDGTGGAQEGFDIWCEWSRGIQRKPYPGDAVLKMHWLSFSSGPGKFVAKGTTLVAELPAEPEEFPVEDSPATGPTSTPALEATAAAGSRREAQAKLEERLVYVHAIERYFDLERHKIIGSDNALEHQFTHMMPKRKTGRASPVKALKESATKRYVDGIGFHPGEGAIFRSGADSFANVYRDRLPQPLEPEPGELQRIHWLFDRLDDAGFRQWLLQFFGHVVQHPGTKIKAAPLIWSDTQGNGKTTLLKMIPSLLVGGQYSREVTCALLNSDFNDYLLNAWHVNLTEFRAGSRGDRAAIAQKLRAWITDPSISIHPKGSAAYDMPNHFFVTATSNEDDAAAIDNNDRRWAVHELHAPQFTETEQEWVYEFLTGPRAPGVLRHFFLHQSLDGFSASAKAPETEARAQMVEAAVSSDLEILRTALEQRTEPLARDAVIVGDVQAYLHKHSLNKPSAARIGRMLAKPPFNGMSKLYRVGDRVYRVVILRNRARWEFATGADIMEHIAGNEVLDLLS